MLQALNSGVSGLQQFQGRLDVIGNNIANSNTVAYKSARSDFADAFSQTLQSSGDGAVQVGSGVMTAATKSLFTQGALARTSLPTDLAIAGEGFFIVRDPLTGMEYATRAGDFRVDADGYLVTNGGMRVQGYSDSSLSARGDVRIDGTGRPATADPAASVVGFSIDSEGRVNVQLSDGTEFARGQVLLQTFRDTQALRKEGNNLYSGIADAGPIASGAQPPGSNGLGRIYSGVLELSNVDLANEFASLITTQRGFQASARIISVSDEILQEVVNLKR